MRRGRGNRKPISSALDDFGSYVTALAWCGAFLVYHIGLYFGWGT